MEQKKLADEWYAFFMEHSPFFRNLSMDRQGEIVMDAVKYQLIMDADHYKKTGKFKFRN